MNQYPPMMLGAPLAAPDPGMAMMAPAPQAPAIDAPEPVYHSMLDKWALTQFQKTADQVEGDELDQLTEQIRKWAKQDKDRDADRNTRMQFDQLSFDLAQAEAPLGDQHKTPGELKASMEELFNSSTAYIFPSKVTHMLAGAGLRMHMPATGTENTEATQKVENYARHYWKEQGDRIALSGGSDPVRMLAHHGTVRGWMTVLQMPKSSDSALPFLLEIEDPLYVHARFARGNAFGPLRVTRQYTLTALEARSEYPETEVLLKDYGDDEAIEIIGYYDEIYHCILICGKDRTGNYQDRMLIGRPKKHEVVDFYGTPMNPWLIIKPLGDLSGATAEGGRRSSKMDGPSALFALHEIQANIDRLVSMMLTQAAKQTDPATVTTYREGQQAPEVLNLERGAHNYLLTDQKHEVIDTAANPQNFMPLWQFLLGERDKVTLPSVFYGDSGGTNSGYQVGLLTNAAMDIIRPYAIAIELMVRMILRRMLEMSYHVTPKTHEFLPMQAQSGIIRQQVQSQQFDPRIIEKTGVMLTVKLGEITPQDRAATSAWVATMVNAGVISRHTARVEAGIDDPQLEFKRIALESLLMDPIIGQMLGPLAASMSDDELYLKGMAMRAQLQQQQALMAPGEGARQAGMRQQPTNVLPTDLQTGQAGPSNNPSDADRAANSAAASNISASSSFLSSCRDRGLSDFRRSTSCSMRWSSLSSFGLSTNHARISF